MAHDLAIRFPARPLDLPAVAHPVGFDDSIVGASDALKYVMYRVEQVAATNATVLLLGETGTGKELVARAIHQQSARRTRSFVVVDCGALPATLIESELFGHERGAFTGADTAQVGGSSGPTAARCSSTRLASCRSSCSPSCCACCRTGRSSGSAARAPSRSTYA